MAYRLEPHETLSGGLKRVAADELRGALHALEGARRLVEGSATSEPAEAGSFDADVHDARKRFKKLRALVQLVRTDLGAEDAAGLDRRFRDAGRQLSALRDAGVLPGTLEGLASAFPERRFQRVLRTAREGFEARQQELAAPEEVARRLEAAAQAVRAVQDEIDDWPLTNRWKHLKPNLRRSYRAGRRALNSAYRDGAEGDDERFHTWRKGVKRLWYHLRLLHPLWPSVMDPLAAQAGDLADLLGVENDLAVLYRTLEAEPESFGATAARQTLLELVTRRRHDLRTAAYPLGRRLYAERPKAFTQRVEGYWDAWQHDSGAKKK